MTMSGTEEAKVFSVNLDMFTDMYDDDTDGRAVDLNKCLLCVASLNNALPLDCHHVFCAPCLRDFFNNSHPDKLAGQSSELNVVCPTCREISTRTWEDLSTDLNITHHEDIQDGKPRVHGTSESSEQGTQNCDVCAFSSKTEESEVYCSKCSLNLCAACKDIHGNHALFKSHPVIHISNKYSVTIHCKKHKQQSGYYCNDCSYPCCAVCILQDHINHSATLFMEAFNQRKERLKSALNNLGPQLDKVESRLKKITYYAEMGSRNDGMNYPGRLKSNRMKNQKENSEPQSLDSQSLDEMPLMMKKPSQKRQSTKLHAMPKGKRRFSIFDNDKSNSKKVAATRKMSFFESVKGKKTELPLHERPRPVVAVMDSSISTSEATAATPLIPSPSLSEDEPSEASYRTSQTTPMTTPTLGKRRSSTSSSHSWHPIVRMGQSSPLIPRRKPLKSTNSEGEMESTFSRKESHPISQKESEPTPPPVQKELLFVPITIKVDNVQIAGYTERVRVFRKLYDFAAKSLQMGHSKKLLEFYDRIVTHIRSVADNEVQELKGSVREIHSEVEKALTQLTPSNSTGSMDLLAAEARKISGDSSGDSMRADEGQSKELSLLFKPVLTWKTEKHKSDPGDLWNRCGVSFLPNGNIVIAEYDMSNTNNNRLHIYDKAGVSVRLLCEGQISPLCVVVCPDGLIAVTDSKSKRVKIIAETGEIISEWGKGQFGWPHGIAVNSKGHFIISDAFNDVISVHHSDGRRIRQFGSSGSGNNHFKNPYHVAVDRQDNIIVSDCGNNCIKVFNSNGEFLFTNRGVSASAIEGLDNKNRRLKSPRGVAIDPKGNILVADDNNRVCMFDCGGKYMRNILTEDEHVKYVEGLATNAEGDLALTECNPTNMIAVKVFHVYTRDIDVTVHQETYKSSYLVI